MSTFIIKGYLKAAKNNTCKPQADSDETRQGAPSLRNSQHHLLILLSTPPSITGPPPTKQDGGAGAGSRARRGAPAAFRRRYGTAGRNQCIRRYPRPPALVPPPLQWLSHSSSRNLASVQWEQQSLSTNTNQAPETLN